MRLQVFLLALCALCCSLASYAPCAMAQDASPPVALQAEPGAAPEAAPAPTEEERQAEARRARARAAAVAIAQAGGPNGWLRREWIMDVNIDLALGQSAKEEGAWAGFGRLRLGVTRVFEPLYLSLGAIGDLNSARDPSFGVQLEALEMISGVQVQLGSSLDTRLTPAALFGLGWEIFGAEGQILFEEDQTQYLFFGKIRVPLSLIYYALTR